MGVFLGAFEDGMGVNQAREIGRVNGVLLCLILFSLLSQAVFHGAA